MRTFSSAAFVLLVCSPAFAQIDGKLDFKVFKPDSADAKLRGDNIKEMRDDVNKRDVEAWRSIKTKADWEKFRDERIAKLRESLGRFPAPPQSVKVVTTKKLEADGCTVECIIYESRPGLYVTANLYVPKDTSKPMPGFIVVHSHHNPKTQGELQDMGLLWARQGCLVLVPDMLGHGERRQHTFVDAKSYPEKFATSRQDYHFRYNVNLQLSLRGESLMGWMVWDLMRGVDVLYQRPGIDKKNIMVFGSVAGGGDPCAVFAALDSRVTAAAPFNFGGPQPETKFPLPEDAEMAFNYMGGGSWESTRNLKLSGRDGFLPWVIVGSIAPRGLIYGHEFAWDEERDPVWKRFNKIWGEFYGAKDKLASAKGRGSVRGTAPESTHCNNIGAEHRKPMYPTLKNWFGLPIPEENKKRFDSSELQCWTDEARKELKPKLVHEILRDESRGSRVWPVGKVPHESKLDMLSISTTSKWVDVLRENGDKLVTLDRVGPATMLPGLNLQMDKIIVRHTSDRKYAVPMVILRPKGDAAISSIVIGVAQDGKAGFLKNRAEAIAALIKSNVAVCLPDLQGTGETASDGRGRTSGATSYSASLLMYGQTMPGVQFQEFALVMRAVEKLGYQSMAIWGDSFAAPNDAKTTLAVPYDNNVKLPRQSEPMGGTLALLGGRIGGTRVKGIYVRGGLVSFASLLDSPFCYFPHDAVIPGSVVYDNTDIRNLASYYGQKSLRMEGLVDGLNRRVDQQTLEKTFGISATVRAEPSSDVEVAAWLAAQFKK